MLDRYLMLAERSSIGRHEIAVVAASQRDADAASLQQLAPQRLRQAQREHLFLELAGARARIMAAVAGIEDDQGPAGVRRALYGRQADFATGGRQGDPPHVVVAPARGARAVDGNDPGKDGHECKQRQCKREAAYHRNVCVSRDRPPGNGPDRHPGARLRETLPIKHMDATCRRTGASQHRPSETTMTP